VHERLRAIFRRKKKDVREKNFLIYAVSANVTLNSGSICSVSDVLQASLRVFVVFSSSATELRHLLQGVERWIVRMSLSVSVFVPHSNFWNTTVELFLKHPV
jgi:hypothetical protein